jgi:hypothetical protein
MRLFVFVVVGVTFFDALQRPTMIWTVVGRDESLIVSDQLFAGDANRRRS